MDILGSRCWFACAAGAQLLDYVVDSRQPRHGYVHMGAFTTDMPPGDALPAPEDAIWYDQAA